MERGEAALVCFTWPVLLEEVAPVVNGSKGLVTAVVSGLSCPVDGRSISLIPSNARAMFSSPAATQRSMACVRRTISMLRSSTTSRCAARSRVNHVM